MNFEWLREVGVGLGSVGQASLGGGWSGVLAAAAPAGGAAAESGLPEAGQMATVLYLTVVAGVFVLSLGMALCVYRLVRGPALADRVLAADLLALHVVGLVILLTIYLGRMVFFDAALAVAILGFVSTVGFAQYIYAQARAEQAEGVVDRQQLRDHLERNEPRDADPAASTPVPDASADAVGGGA